MKNASQITLFGDLPASDENRGVGVRLKSLKKKAQDTATAPKDDVKPVSQPGIELSEIKELAGPDAQITEADGGNPDIATTDSANLDGADLDADAFNADLPDSDLVDTDLVDTDSAEIAVVVPNVVNTDQVNTDPVHTDLLNNDVIDNDFVNTDIVNTDIVNTDLVNTDILNSDIVSNEIVNDQLADTDIVDPGLSNTDIVNTDLLDTRSVNTDFADIDSVKSKSLRFEPFANTELVHAENLNTDSSDESDVSEHTTQPSAIKSQRGRKSLKNIESGADLINIPPDEELFKKQYYAIGEVAEMFHVNQSLIRFWETEFDIIQPRKNRKGDRHFRPIDIKNLLLIHDLLRRRKLTIEGAKDFLKKNKRSPERFAMIQSLQQIKAFILEVKATL